MTEKQSYRQRRAARKAAKKAREEYGLQDRAPAPQVDIPPNDPVIGYFHSVGHPVDMASVDIESPGAEALRAAGVALVVPLLSQGELIGLLNLGPRLSEQEYSSEDRRLLDNLAGQVAPAVRNAQLVLQQKEEVAKRERIQQELEVARIVQQHFLPAELPKHAGWEVAVHYQAARIMGGDFYDFVELPDERIGIVAADVTDKGVPAALVMSATLALLRASSRRLIEPDQVLERVNDLMVEQVPPKMFITCLYGVLDLKTGAFRFANAGHNLPYVSTEDGPVELRARGMPLGLMQGMRYEVTESVLQPGGSMLLHSDGISEAHSPDGDMFGFPRLLKMLNTQQKATELIDSVLTELRRFTGPEWEQEDDITLVVLRRSAGAIYGSEGSETPAAKDDGLLAEFSVPSEPGNERIAMRKVEEAVTALEMEAKRLEKLKTAVAEATMNAIEHGNENRAELPVDVTVKHHDDAVVVTIRDRGGAKEIKPKEEPDIEAKLRGEQTPRGWGLFLIKNMVDDMQVETDGTYHIVQLTMNLKGASDG